MTDDVKQAIDGACAEIWLVHQTEIGDTYYTALIISRYLAPILAAKDARIAELESRLVIAAADWIKERESAESYGVELDKAAELLQKLHPIGKVKALGRLEVVAALKDVLFMYAARKSYERPSHDD